jgi:hypothetical protein
MEGIMRYRTMTIAAVLVVAGAPALAASDSMPGWLTGCWSEEKGANWTEECWTAPRVGNMLGSGRNGRDQDLRSWEAMQIELGSDGKPVLYGSVKGGPRVPFPMVSSGPREIVFANPKHDYPQRIRYWRDGMDLNAETSLMDGTSVHRWHYRRQGGS